MCQALLRCLGHITEPDKFPFSRWWRRGYNSNHIASNRNKWVNCVALLDGKRRSVLGGHWRDWCWSWNSNTLATWCKELTHLKRPYCWERLKAGGEGDDRGWDGWTASPTQWTWVWVNSGSWWWTARPGVLRFMGLQRVGHNWVTELTDWMTDRW